MRVFPPDDGTGSGAMGLPVPVVSAGTPGTPTPAVWSFATIISIAAVVAILWLILKGKPQ